MIKETTIQAVKSLPIKDVLEGAGLTFVRQGGKYAALCPLHGDKNPSLTLNDDNTWHCYGCGEHGDGIKFYMQRDSLEFGEAVEAIAKAHGVRIEYEKSAADAEASAVEREEREERKRVFAINAMVQEFFAKCLYSDLPGAREAREYAFGRWGEEQCASSGVGYAPAPGELFAYLREKGISEAEAVTAGVLRMGKDEFRPYAAFRNRVTIPIINSRRQVGGFTCRAMNPDDPAKYKNTGETCVFRKGDWLWGMDKAARAARKLNGFIVVEGAADAMRLRGVGLDNAVATMGTALTGNHLQQMLDESAKVTFIPDCDTVKDGQLYGAGTKAVLKSGLMAMTFGFEVNVKEIPQSDPEKKEDADSYITSREKYAELKSEPYVVWSLRTRLIGAHSEVLKLQAMRETAEALMYVRDKMLREMYIELLSKIYGKVSQWREALKQAGKALFKEESADKDKKTVKDLGEEDYAILREKGMLIDKGCYMAADNEGGLKRLSNFYIRPVLMVMENMKATRIMELINNRGFRNSVEMSSGELTSLRNFKEKLLDRGNFVWLSESGQTLTAIQEYLGEVMPMARRIMYMGWNKEHELYAFGDGVYKDGRLYKANNLGVVKVEDKSYFLPAYSTLYTDDPKKFDFERTCKYSGGSGLSLREYADGILQVYGGNGMVCLAWVLAALFRDIIFDHVKHFPILNLYGRKGSGKTDLAKVLNSLVYVVPQAPNSCSNTSVPVIAYTLEHGCNSVYILDEFTNDLKDFRVDILKGLWGGVSQSKMGEDGQPITMKVLSGVILAGQYVPEDEAIFSRCLHLPFMTTSFDEEQVARYQEFFNTCLKGNAHLLGEILRHRETFASGYGHALKMTEEDINISMRGIVMDTSRLKNNWIEVLAAYRVLARVLDLPLGYSDMLEIFIKGLKYHNEQASKGSDTSEFWNAMDSMHYQGKVKEKCHFIIKYETSFKPLEKSKSEVTFTRPKRVIYVNLSALRPLLIQWNSRKQGNTLNISTLESYLKSLPQYLGKKLQRFQFLKPNGDPDESYRHEYGTERKVLYGNGVRAACFDYDDLEESLGINLETIELAEDFDKETATLFGDPEAAKATEPTDDRPF